MISGRRTARETALLVLFSVDVGKEPDYSTALDNFRDHLRNDNELLTVLLGFSEYAPAPDSLDWIEEGTRHL